MVYKISTSAIFFNSGNPGFRRLIIRLARGSFGKRTKFITQSIQINFFVSRPNLRTGPGRHGDGCIDRIAFVQLAGTLAERPEAGTSANCDATMGLD